MSYDNVLDGHILSIVQTQEIHEQVDLQDKLKDRGYDIPQATLSRRLKKLKIAKVAGLYRIVDFNLPSLPLVLNLKVSDSGIIVLHTHPGSASSLGEFIDRKYVPLLAEDKESKILGTIAGDNTVILIIQFQKDLPSVLAAIQEDFPYLKI